MTGRTPGGPRRTGALAIAAGLLAAGLALTAAGCGGRRLVAGTAPFPADKPVFTDGEGRVLKSLPASPEPLKVVVLDFPWCPPCAEAWKAVRAASGALAPGTVRVYRIVFDRERYFTRNGVSVVPPLRPAAPAEPPGAVSPAFAVTTLTAAPDAFREEYELEQAPVILLLGRTGKVVKRWAGYSPSLSTSLETEIRRVTKASQDSSESPPPPP